MSVEQVRKLLAEYGVDDLIINEIVACVEQLQDENNRLADSLHHFIRKFEAYKRLNPPTSQQMLTAPATSNTSWNADVEYVQNQPSTPDTVTSKPIDRSFFRHRSGPKMQACEEVLLDILYECRTKAQVCRRLYKSEAAFFRLAAFSNEDKARLIEQFRTDDMYFGKLTDNDFKHYWKKPDDHRR